MEIFFFRSKRLQIDYFIVYSFNTDGFNVRINVGQNVGQTVNHVHIYLITKYKGDAEEPRGGVRGVIPSKRKY